MYSVCGECECKTPMRCPAGEETMRSMILVCIGFEMSERIGGYQMERQSIKTVKDGSPCEITLPEMSISPRTPNRYEGHASCVISGCSKLATPSLMSNVASNRARLDFDEPAGRAERTDQREGHSSSVHADCARRKMAALCC